MRRARRPELHAAPIKVGARAMSERLDDVGMRNFRLPGNSRTQTHEVAIASWSPRELNTPRWQIQFNDLVVAHAHAYLCVCVCVCGWV